MGKRRRPYKMSEHERVARGYPAKPEPQDVINLRKRLKYEAAHPVTESDQYKKMREKVVSQDGRYLSRFWVNYRNCHLKKKFGITEADYLRMLEIQGGVCAACGNPPKGKRLAVDHNHTTGQIRGLLCVWCNRIVGVLEEETLVAKLVAYLEKYDKVSLVEAADGSNG